jgi:hypothetical protein
MNKTIIGVYGGVKEGKSSTIKMVCKKLLSDFPNAITDDKNINYNADINLIIKLGKIWIGIESQGDPNSRMITEDTIKKLAFEECQIIICATRTSGETVKKVDSIANKFDYSTIWKSSYFTSDSNNFETLNRMAAEEIIGLIKSLIAGQI